MHVVDARRLLVERHARSELAEVLDARCELLADRDVQALDLVGVEPVCRRERREPCGVEDLVGVRAPDAGDRALVAQQGVQLAAVVERALQRGHVERVVERLGSEAGELCLEPFARVQPDP